MLRSRRPSFYSPHFKQIRRPNYWTWVATFLWSIVNILLNINSCWATLFHAIERLYWICISKRIADYRVSNDKFVSRNHRRPGCTITICFVHGYFYSHFNPHAKSHQRTISSTHCKLPLNTAHGNKVSREQSDILLWFCLLNMHMCLPLCNDKKFYSALEHLKNILWLYEVEENSFFVSLKVVKKANKFWKINHAKREKVYFP